MKLEKKIRAAIIGGSESGKTFRAIGYSRGLWRVYGIRSIVFDPWLEENDWGPQAWATKDFEMWKRAVLGSKDCAAFWDEATTNGGDDENNAGLATEIRHLHWAMFMMGHSHSSIARVMRVNLTHLDLALSDDVDAVLWARTMKDPALKDAYKEDVLPQYHWMQKSPYKPTVIRSEGKEEILRGIVP